MAIVNDDLTELTEFFQVVIEESLEVSFEGVALFLTSQESDRISVATDQAQIIILDSDSEMIPLNLQCRY